MSTAREHLAWLMWCWQEGYTKSHDRVILSNWIVEDPANLTPEDQKLRADLLQAADEVLAALLPDGLLMTDAQVGELARLRAENERWRNLDPDAVADQMIDAADRIERLHAENAALRRWKAEATTVIAGWEAVWEAAACPAPLGASKYAALLAELRRLQAAERDLRVQVDRLGDEIDRW